MRRLVRSPRAAYLVVAIVLLVIVQLTAVVATGVSARSNSIAVARDAISRETDTTIESILRHLEPAEQSVDVTSRLIDAGLLDMSDPALERYLFTQLAVMPQMTGAFVGFPDGSFVFVSRDGDGFRTKRIAVDGERTVEGRGYDAAFELRSTEQLLDDTYDPVERPWYAGAVDVDGISWTEPYVFFSSGNPGVTASEAVRDDRGRVIAVVGVDVELSGLDAFLDDLAVAESGEAFVISGSTVIAAPTSYDAHAQVDDDGGLRLLTIDELGVPALQQDVDEAVQSISNDGRAELVLHRTFPAEHGVAWSVVVRAPESSFTSVVAAQQRLALWIVVGGGVIVLLGALLLVRVTRPISQLHAWASTDPLTGLVNRRRLGEEATKMADRLGGDERMSVLLLDLDGFKELNDRFGHHTGDRALELVARELRELTRRDDIVARLGGDEFVVVQRVREVGEGVQSARRILQRITDRLRDHLPHSAIGATGGITVSDDAVTEFEMLLLEADAALINAKIDYKGMLQLADRLVTASM